MIKSVFKRSIKIIAIIPAILFFSGCRDKNNSHTAASVQGSIMVNESWKAPDTSSIPRSAEGNQIRYGRSLIANTAFYFGPKGKISREANGMNCQNCHLDAGTRPWGGNYSGVFSMYPLFRERRGAPESIFQRVSDCFERSLNGKAPDSSGIEMRSILAYLKWLGQDVPKGKKPIGSGMLQLAFLNRAADQQKGKKLYEIKCVQCHGLNGQGMLAADSINYTYPPLWGMHSYNVSAGLYRISRFAGFIKDNMPFGATHQNAQLTDEEAWDIAAFVNSQPRPVKIFKEDWPDIFSKPVDHPFGPYADGFNEQQHKYGPFGPIIKAKAFMRSRLADSPHLQKNDRSLSR